MLPAPFIPTFHVSPPLCVTVMQLHGHATNLALPADIWVTAGGQTWMSIIVSGRVFSALKMIFHLLVSPKPCSLWSSVFSGTLRSWDHTFCSCFPLIIYTGLRCQLRCGPLPSFPSGLMGSLPSSEWAACTPTPECHCCVTWPFYKVCYLYCCEWLSWYCWAFCRVRWWRPVPQTELEPPVLPPVPRVHEVRGTTQWLFYKHIECQCH